MAFCVWLLSLNLTSLGFIRVVALTSFHFMAKYYSPGWPDPILPIPPSAAALSGFRATGSRAAARRDLCVWTNMSVSLGCVPTRGIAERPVAPSPWSPGRSGHPSSAADLRDPSSPTPCLHKGCLPQVLRPRSTLPSAPLQPLACLPAPWLGHTPSCHQPLLTLRPLPRMFLPLPFPPFGWELSPQGDGPTPLFQGGALLAVSLCLST